MCRLYDGYLDGRAGQITPSTNELCREISTEVLQLSLLAQDIEKSCLIQLHTGRRQAGKPPPPLIGVMTNPANSHLSPLCDFHNLALGPYSRKHLAAREA